MYSVYDYGAMFKDSQRVQAYVTALERVITPTSVVVDIGTGTGIFAFLACQLGAPRVYAIETNDAIHVAAQIARANGYADRIQFIQQPANQVQLPEQADVMVSDLRGTLPLYDQHIPIIMDARRRFLKTDGALLPQRDTLVAALITAPDLYPDYSDVWESFSLDMRAGRDHAMHTPGTYRPAVDQLLTAPQPFATLDYHMIESPNISGKATFTAQQSGTAHGYSVWFDAEVMDGLTYSNAPSEPEQVYGHLYLPLEQAVPVEVGDRVEAKFVAKLIGDDYVWQWNTTITTESGQHHFKQSTLLASPLSPTSLRQSRPDYRPELNEKGAMLLQVLQHIQAHKTNAEIAAFVFAEFPNEFADLAAAATYVKTTVARYSQ